MRPPLVLALSASVAALAAAAPMFSRTPPGPANVTAQTTAADNIVAFGAGGAGAAGWVGGIGGMGAKMGGTFSLLGGETRRTAVGAASGGGISAGGGDGGFVVAPDDSALVFTTYGVGGIGGGGQGGTGGDVAGSGDGGLGGGSGGGPLGTNLGSVGSALREAAFAPAVVGGTGPSSNGSLGLSGGGGIGGNGGGGPLLGDGGGTSFDTGNKPLNISDFRPGDGGALIPPKPDSVPEPAGLALFGAGLLGLGLVRRPRRSG